MRTALWLLVAALVGLSCDISTYLTHVELKHSSVEFIAGVAMASLILCFAQDVMSLFKRQASE